MNNDLLLIKHGQNPAYRPSDMISYLRTENMQSPRQNHDYIHKPVLLHEVMNLICLKDSQIIVDCTFGTGGYTSAFLENKNYKIYAIDRDPDALLIGEKLSLNYHNRLKMIDGCFSNIETLIPEKVDSIILDIGVSSLQLDKPTRGFSFRYNGPLDMRMSISGYTAADYINSFDQDKIANILYEYGQERAARKIARKIVFMRKKKPFCTTFELAEVVRSVVQKSKDGLDPATRTFQALRIYVNDELKELHKALFSAEKILKPNGRLAIVTFHSLEEHYIKYFIKLRCHRKYKKSRLLPGEKDDIMPMFTLITQKPIIPKEDEVYYNRRARSAKLHVFSYDFKS